MVRLLPTSRGPHAVGSLDIMTEFSSSGCFIRLFYPTDSKYLQASGHHWPCWLPDRHYIDGYADFFDLNLLTKQYFKAVAHDLRIPSVWKSPILRSENPYPVVVFSHGLGGCRTAYSTICCELASNGYVVAAVEHRDGSACITFYSSEVQNAEPAASNEEKSSSKESAPTIITAWMAFQRLQPSEEEYPIRNRQVNQRVDECLKCLSVLETLNQGENVQNMLDSSFNSQLFKGCFDLSQLVIMGHSFGGATTVAVLAQEKKFKVGVCLDPWLLPIRKEDEIFCEATQPILFINTESFQSPANIRDLHKLQLDSPDRPLVTIKGIVHQSQTDAAFLVGPLLGRLFKLRASLDPTEAIHLNNSLILAFLGDYLDVSWETKFIDFVKLNKDKLIQNLIIEEPPTPPEIIQNAEQVFAPESNLTSDNKIEELKRDNSSENVKPLETEIFPDKPLDENVDVHNVYPEESIENMKHSENINQQENSIIVEEAVKS